MIYRKSLLVCIWAFAVAIILIVFGVPIAEMGIIYHAGGWFTSGWTEVTWVYYLGVVMTCFGFIVLILGIFGIVTTLIRELLDRREEVAK